MADEQVEVTGVRNVLARLNLLINEMGGRNILAEIGNYLVFSIKRRTQEEHEDIEGRPFVAYSPKYAFFREQKGYGTEVDLTLSGGMFNALTYETAKDHVRIFFGSGSSPGTDVQHPAKAFYLQDKRKFFGYTAEDVQKITDLYAVNIGRAVSGRK